VVAVVVAAWVVVVLEVVPIYVVLLVVLVALQIGVDLLWPEPEACTLKYTNIPLEYTNA
jgi:hypothetical protein